MKLTTNICYSYIWRGDLTEDFLRYPFGGGGGLIFRGAYFRNFTVCPEFRKKNTKTGILLKQRDCVFFY